MNDEENEKGVVKNKKVHRRSRKNKNDFKNFKVYYVNIRGVKSKIDSLVRIANETQPQVMCVTETMLGEKEKIDIPNYEIFYNCKKAGQAGIIIAIKENLKPVTVETERTSEEYQSLWIKIDNGKNKINVGCVYAPQESKTKLKTYTQMYKDIETRIKKIKVNKERLVLTGDFNCKIGSAIKGNKEEITKSGRILLKMALENELQIQNTSHQCEGTWTRISGEEKSVLDYIITLNEDERYISSVKIDEKKEITPRHKEGRSTVYTDHCAFVIQIQWEMANIERSGNKRISAITDKSLENIKKATEKGILTEIACENIDLDEKYNKWNKEMSRIIQDATEMKFKKKNQQLKSERNLNMVKKNIQKRTWTRSMKKQQTSHINEIIENEIRLQKARQTIKMAKILQSDSKMHAGTFWEFKKKMDRKEKGETPSCMKNKEGEEKSTREEIKEIFAQFYKDLHAFSFISNTFISNTRLRFAYFETRISKNNEIWIMRPFQNDCTHSK